MKWDRKKVNIENAKLRIRNATAKDAQILSRWWNDGKVMAHAGFPYGIGISETEIVETLKDDDDLRQRLIIEFENEPIGEMSYRTPEEKTAEIGIKICDSSQQNKGYGTEYLKMLMKYIFMSMEYDKIILDTNLKNERAQYVYERLGFRQVRTNIDSWKDQLGELQSSVDYEMSREEYVRLYCN
ncbi:MAG: GNAT family N-acetyltransferase [Planctomycetes bacterium]|nr:GNAT family N-acetyltransferase [Planctomycetota bacterium]